MQRAGPVEVSLNDVVITLGRDLLPIFKPINLGGGKEGLQLVSEWRWHVLSLPGGLLSI